MSTLESIMNKNIKNILKKIEDNGYKAYLVGGYVRDTLLGKKSYDIDICTNALPVNLHKLFPNNNNSNNYGGFNLKINEYNIDITTFREEIKYENRKPTELIYIDSLEKDILRRDFTINAICMDKNEKIIDLVGGVNDLNNHLIKVIGDVDTKLEEDPLRILRAIRFACVLNFDIDGDLYEGICKYNKLILTLSKDRVKSELNKILMNKNYLKGLKLLKDTNILELLEIDYEDITYVNDICGMWAQLKAPNFAFTKQENMNIINIRQIINEGVINNFTLFKYGLYNSLVAGKILNIKDSVINKMYNKLPIKSKDDLDINGEEIIDSLNIQPSKKIREVEEELIREILNNKIPNKNKELKKYIINRKEN